MKVGIIGCGNVAGTHMRAYKTIKSAEVAGVADMNFDRAKAFAAEHRIKKTFSNYRDLLEVKDLTLVDICTPTSTHELITCDAARSGVNVIMEKPMSRNSDQCERMIREARKHGVQLCICHNQLFYPHVKELKSIAEGEDFGFTSFRTTVKENFEFLKAHSFAHDWNASPEHGGILWETGCHLAYLQLHFLRNITEVYALAVKARYQVWDDFMVLLRTNSQLYGVIDVSWVVHEPEIVYEVVGSKGGRVQGFTPHGYIINRDQDSLGGATDVLRSFLSDEGRVLTKWGKFWKDQIRKPTTGHLGLIRSYVESLEKSSASPVTGEDGRNTIKLLECIEKSLLMKQPIEYSAW